MALVPVLLLFIVNTAFASAHQAAWLMRHDGTQDAESLVEVQKPPRHVHRASAEVAEAFSSPSKIDDSFLGHWSPRMPDSIEQYPWFYATAFVGGAMAFLGVICLYSHHEDSKDEARRDFYASIRKQAEDHAMQRHGANSFNPTAPMPTAAVIRAAAEHAASARSPHGEPMLVPAPKAAAMRPTAERNFSGYAEAAEDSMLKLSNVVGNLTGMLAGENVSVAKENMRGSGKYEKYEAAATDTTGSGASTPRSQVSSQHSSVGSGNSRSADAHIRSGTVLMARVPEVIFASASSWQEIGSLRAGQQVVAAGPPEMIDSYSMVPVKPRGAVDMKTLEVVRRH